MIDSSITKTFFLHKAIHNILKSVTVKKDLP